MTMRLNFLTFLVITLVLAVSADSMAEPIGYSSPTGFSGIISRIRLQSPTQILDLKQSADPNDALQAGAVGTLSGAGNTYEGAATTTGYTFHGYANYTIADPTAANLPMSFQVGGYFSDELFVQSADNKPLSLEFLFNLHASAAIDASNSSAVAILNLAGAIPGLGYINGTNNFDLINLTNPPAIALSSGNSDPVTIDTMLSFTTPLIASGSFLPLRFGLWGTVSDGWIDWLNTGILSGVNAYNSAGELLEISSFTVLSSSGNRLFNEEFAHGNPTAATPEPGTMLLMGIGAAGVAWMRRRQAKQS